MGWKLTPTQFRNCECYQANPRKPQGRTLMDSWYRKKRYPKSRRAQEAEERSNLSAQKWTLDIKDKVYSARIYPNGEFGVGMVPPPKKRRADADYDAQIVDNVKYDLLPRTHELEDGTILHDTTDKFLQPSLKLGSPCELSQTHEKEKKRYGLKGITGYGKRCIRNIGYQIETSGAKGYCQMATLTIPRLSLEGNRVLCQSWSGIVRSFFQACKREYSKCGKRFEYVSCTEIQEKRFKKYGDCGLHLHFVYRAAYKPGTKQWILPDNWVRRRWHEILMGALRKARHVSTKDLQKCNNTTINYRREKIKKSAAGYLAKYLSKGSEIIADIARELGEEYLPSQWWSADMFSKKRLKQSIIRDRGDIARMLIDMCSLDVCDLLMYAFPATISRDDGKEIIIGYFGRLTSAGMRFISTVG